MAFVTGLLLIDAPASALNNLGQVTGRFAENATAVKSISTPEGRYPYVSAQAFRYWLRTTLEKGPWGWKAAPVYREDKIAYTDANPIRWWDDDLMGYMRSPSDNTGARQRRAQDPEYQKLTPLDKDKKGKELAVTRVSPFRVSSLVALSPSHIVWDFGTMSRHEGDPVPHEHEFYRATLQGLFSLDLHMAGTFTYINRTGFLNLDEHRKKEAEQKGLEHLPEEKAYRLPLEERLQRIRALFEGLAHLEGGAKLTLHYTDVSPDVVFLAVTRGGNHIFGHIFGANDKGQPVLNLEALAQALRVYEDGLLSDVFVGWTKGFLDDQLSRLEAALQNDGPLAQCRERIHISHPREAFQALIQALEEHPEWLA